MGVGAQATTTTTTINPWNHHLDFDLATGHGSGTLDEYSSSPSIQVDYHKAEHGDPVSDEEEDGDLKLEIKGKPKGKHSKDIEGNASTSTQDIQSVDEDGLAVEDKRGSGAGKSRKATVSLQLFKQAAKAAASAARERQRSSAASTPAAVPNTDDSFSSAFSLSPHPQVIPITSPTKHVLQDPTVAAANQARSTFPSSSSVSSLASSFAVSSPVRPPLSSIHSIAGSPTFQLQFRNASGLRSPSFVSVEATLPEKARGGRSSGPPIPLNYQTNPNPAHSRPQTPSRSNSNSSLQSSGSKPHSTAHTPIRLSSSRSSSSHGFQYPRDQLTRSTSTTSSLDIAGQSADSLAQVGVANGVVTPAGLETLSPLSSTSSPLHVSNLARSRPTSPKLISLSDAIPSTSISTLSSTTSTLPHPKTLVTAETLIPSLSSSASLASTCLPASTISPQALISPASSSITASIPPSLEESVLYTPISGLPQISTTISPSMPLRRKSFKIVSSGSSRPRGADRRDSIVQVQQLPLPQAAAAPDFPESGTPEKEIPTAKATERLSKSPSLADDSGQEGSTHGSKVRTLRMSRRQSLAPTNADEILPPTKEEQEYDYELDIGDRNAEGKHEGILSHSQRIQDEKVAQASQLRGANDHPLALADALDLDALKIDDNREDKDEIYKSDSLDDDSAPSYNEDDEQQQQHSPYAIVEFRSWRKFGS